MRFAFYLVLTVVSIFSVAADTVDVYIGTYTKGDSQGIYRTTLDSASGTLSEAVLVAVVENPSFLALSTDKQYLYSVIETAKFKGQPGGGLVAYRIEGDGKLKELNSRNTGGGAPCHLSVSPDGEAVLVANYSGGNVASFPIEADGSLGNVASVIQHEGSSVNPKRQSAPHAHAINIFGKGKYAAAADLGTDSIFIYEINDASLKQVTEVKVKPGSGARHIAFHPTEKYAYVINEMSLTVAVFQVGGPAEWEAIQYLSTLPEGDDPKGSTAEIQMHPSGKFVYGSNRGHDTIVAYSIDQKTGKLTWIENEPIDGQIPRGFNITPDGKYLLAAGQKSDTITVFSINPETGELDHTGNQISVSSPVSIEFR